MTARLERAASLHAEGVAASTGGRPALAVRKFRAALRLLNAGDGSDGDGSPDDAELRGRVLISLAWPESELGRVDLAFRLLEQAEPLLPHWRRPLWHSQRALLLKRNGRNDLALREYDAAIAGLTELNRTDELVGPLNNRSIVHLEAGRLGAARQDLRRCLGIVARDGPELLATVVRVNLGCLDIVAGDLPSALSAFEAARRDYLRLAPGRLPELAVDQARALTAAGLFREADEQLAVAVAELQTQQQSHLYGDALHVRAEASLLGGQPELAARWAEQAGSQFRHRHNARRAASVAGLAVRADYAASGPSPALGVRARRLAARLRMAGLTEDARVAALVGARCLLHTGQSAAAERLVHRYGPPGRVDRLDTRLLWRLVQAELAAAADRPGDASRQLLAGMTALHRYRAQFGCLDLQTGASVHGRDLAGAGLRTALAAGSAPAVYRWSERARAQALLLAPVRPPDDPPTAAALEELRQTRHALREAELAGRPATELRAQAERLQRAVRERSWSVAGPAAPTGEVRGPWSVAGRGRPASAAPAPIGEVRAELADAVLVAYLRAGPALHALVISRSAAVVVPLGGYERAERALLRLRADLDTPAGRAMPRRLADAVTAATRHDAVALAAVVLDPLRAHLGDRPLVVVPTGLLMTTPWAALPGCAGRPVTVAASATAWLTAVRRRRAEARASGVRLVAGPGLARSEQEVHAIAELYPGSTVLAGADATPAAALAALNGVAVAHIAAHGSHQAENALFSSLELATGPVLGYDLQRLPAAPAMVVLSSCELGLTDVRPGDESFGLASALLAAGTTTVVASVSRVADDEAMAAMVRFHEAVAAGQAPATALASAVRADSTAGFVCLGAG